jgi:N-methylhydantoinase A/oxoprolinase/acetone carboxylase beta subunit
MRIGVDVGGTNTDAVLMDGERVVSWAKSPTTADVSGGRQNAITAVLTESGVSPRDIGLVMIGTTHFTNAFVERKRLLEVGVLRLALPAGRGIPPLADWPEAMKAAIGDHVFEVSGGYQYDGRVNSALDEGAVAAAADEMVRRGLKSVAISGVFSHVKADMEVRAAEIFAERAPHMSVSLSHRIGRLGMLERENATVMNACLADLSGKVVRSFAEALRQLRIAAPFYISQNDGTLMSGETVLKYPVLTFASGPTNSMRGAAYLSGLKDAIVVDVGGTTTDVGVLINGFPRESSVTVDIGGVRTNFRMPDVLSIGLGGGSIVRPGATPTVGPDSVGFRLTQEARVFGGDVLTASDIAVASGLAEIGEVSRVADLPSGLAATVLAVIQAKVEEAVDRMRTSAQPLPLVLVGGGAVLVDGAIQGTSEIVRPKFASVANAIGAAIAQVSGEVDRVFAYGDIGRDAAIAAASGEAVDHAVGAGAARETVQVIDVEEVPLAYVPGGAVRLRVRAVGDLVH